MKAEIYPAILAHELEEYTARLELVEGSAATWLHIDFMDGRFVPNFTIRPEEVGGISTHLKLEAHLMVQEPESYFSSLAVGGFARILLHRELYPDLEACNAAITRASDYFPEVGLVLNPQTAVEPFTGLKAASIQCMGVEPGVSGQTILESVYDQIKAVADQRLAVPIAVDGGVTSENIRQLQEIGASRFVIASHIFLTEAVAQNVQQFIQLVSGGV